MMLQNLFPARVDNEGYAGLGAALWLLGVILLLKTIMGVNGTLNAAEVASGADGVALAGLPDDAAATILQLFRGLSIGQLPLVLVGTAVLLRWRSLAPFLFLVLIAEQLSRRAVAAAYAAPGAATASIGTWINLGILAALVAGLLLSLWPRRR